MFRRSVTYATAVIMVLASAAAAFAGERFSYAESKTVLGRVKTYKVKDGETLLEIARRYDLGYNEIIDANPNVDPWMPEGHKVIIPSQWILPDVERDGIVINTAEMRMFYFFEEGGRKFVKTYPIGVGIEGFETPVGEYKIIEKIKDPVWRVPPSILAENRPGLEPVVPPGEDNPLGTHALRLSDPQYLIHGTNNPFGVGRRVSRGCIRMYPEDIIELYSNIKSGTRVKIVYQPIKIGYKGGKAYVELHNDFLNPDKKTQSVLSSLLKKKNLLSRAVRGRLKRLSEDKKGIPRPI